jgi:hypothetical protein
MLKLSETIHSGVRLEMDRPPADVVIWDPGELDQPMPRNLWKLVLGCGLLGCGGQPNALPVGFVNQTKHSDADLWVIWKAAQEIVDQEVDLNPLQRSSSGSPADIRPGDPRALGVMPHQLKVSAEEDVSASALLAATGLERSDPTGMIACPEPCNVRFAVAYPFYSRDLTRYAASWEDKGDSFTFVLEYEFENQILAALGYSLRWR